MHTRWQVMLDGIRAGLVAVSAAGATVEPYAAVIIGLLAGPAYLGSAAAVLQVSTRCSGCASC
jgi:ammonia channel protein AmtB